MKRVVITGLGGVTPIGIGKEQIWHAMENGVSGIDTIAGFDLEGHKVTIAGEVRDWNFDAFKFKDFKARQIDRVTQFSLIAARDAIEDARLEFNDDYNDDVASIIGTGIGGIGTLLSQHDQFQKTGPRRVSPRAIAMIMVSTMSANVSLAYKLTGPTWSTGSACASSLHAIITGFNMIRLGEVGVVISGGCECVLHPLIVASFANTGALTKDFNDAPQKASRPFDAKRSGFVIGEGAGVVVLEEYERAVKRGAHIYGELIGYGASSDAFDIVAPDPSARGSYRAMVQAMEHAGVTAADIADKTYINMHGTSTELGDLAETQAVKKLFGNRAGDLSLSSTKSVHGHLLGGAAALEQIACMLALDKGVIPPTINLENPDPECDLNYTPQKTVHKDVTYAMNNSFGFGGTNGVLIAKKIE